MATLEELRQKKESGVVNNPDSLRTLSKEDLKKIMPNTAGEGDTPTKIIQNEMNDLDAFLNTRMSSADKSKEEFVEKNKEEFDSAIFDTEIENFDNGTMNSEEIDKSLAEAYNNAVKNIKEDPNIKAGVEAVTNVGKNTTTTTESADMEDLLKELDDDDDFDDDQDKSDISELDEDDDIDDEDNEREDQKKMLKDMQDQIGTVLKPFDNIIDLKSFTISTKPKSAKKVLEEVSVGPTATWVLLDSKTPFTCTALGAIEIENLDPNKTEAKNGRIDALKQMYGTLYRHYVSPNKPKTLEEWVKTISYTDQDNLIFGYYKATFGDANYITYACEKCKEVKVENVPIEKCIKYSTEETKQEVENILKYGDPTHKSEIKAKLVQVSDKLAVSIKNPSIYNIVFEFGVLDSEFTNKFADVLGVAGYIEDIYEIDVYERKLIPIKVKEDSKNLTKSVKRRIRSKVEILKTLKPDQYNILTSEIANIAKNAERISYCQPEYECKKCKTKIAEAEMSAQQMLFIRHQLALIKTLSIE